MVFRINSVMEYLMSGEKGNGYVFRTKNLWIRDYIGREECAALFVSSFLDLDCVQVVVEDWAISWCDALRDGRLNDFQEWNEDLIESSSTPNPSSPEQFSPATASSPPLSGNNSTSKAAVTTTTITTTTNSGSKTMHVCPHCNFETCMSQHMKSHLVSFHASICR